MNESNERTQGIDLVQREDARVGYKVAVDLWTYQGQLNWNRFNIMLVANSVIISGIGVAFSSQRPLPSIFTSLLPIVGLLLCGVWVYLTARGFDYHKYWGSRALELEKEHLKDTVKTVAEARSSKDEEKPGKINFAWLSELGGLVRTQRVPAYIVILVFTVVYIVALLSLLRT